MTPLDIHQRIRLIPSIFIAVVNTIVHFFYFQAGPFYKCVHCSASCISCNHRAFLDFILIFTLNEGQSWLRKHIHRRHDGSATMDVIQLFICNLVRPLCFETVVDYVHIFFQHTVITTHVEFDSDTEVGWYFDLKYVLARFEFETAGNYIFNGTRITNCAVWYTYFMTPYQLQFQSTESSFYFLDLNIISLRKNDKWLQLDFKFPYRLEIKSTYPFTVVQFYTCMPTNVNLLKVELNSFVMIRLYIDAISCEGQMQKD